jgi:molybdenum cofactor biosynthesis enzyme MoaA
MNFDTFSVVVGDKKCNASCPWCIAKRTKTNFDLTLTPNWHRFNRVCAWANRITDTAILTGKGEPTLHWDLLVEYTERLHRYRFDFIELMTNGALLSEAGVAQLEENGLTTLCLSIAHPDNIINNQLMGLPEDYDYRKVIAYANKAGLAVRLNVTVVKGGVTNLGDMVNVITTPGVMQSTFREVSHATEFHSSLDWLRDCLEGYADLLLEYDYGLRVYNYQGYNVAVSNCLTESVNPRKQRQLIFWPNGELTYSWTNKAARIL